MQESCRRQGSREDAASRSRKRYGAISVVSVPRPALLHRKARGRPPRPRLAWLARDLQQLRVAAAGGRLGRNWETEAEASIAAIGNSRKQVCQLDIRTAVRAAVRPPYYGARANRDRDSRATDPRRRRHAGPA